jgi:hypothetical protein
MPSIVTAGPEAVAEASALQAQGATRILIPSVVFGPEPAEALARFGQDVIGQV